MSEDRGKRTDKDEPKEYTGNGAVDAVLNWLAGNTDERPGLRGKQVDEEVDKATDKKRNK